MNKAASFILFFAVLLSLSTANAGDLQQINITNLGGHPESVFSTHSEIFVSNMGQEGGLRKDGDGFVSRLDLNGNLIESDFIPADGSLHSPTAMAYYRGELMVADIDRIVRFDFFSRKVKGLIDFAPVGAGFVNDLQFIGGNALAVTESTLKKVFIVDLPSGQYRELEYVNTSSPFAPNGLVFEFAKDFDGGTLYVAENEMHALGVDHGRVTAVRLNSEHDVMEVKHSPQFGNFIDGIAVSALDELIVSDWVAFGASGRLHILAKESLNLKTAYTVTSDGFADFAYSDPTSRLYSPDLLNGNLVVHQFPGAFESPESGESYLMCRARIKIEACMRDCDDQVCLRECLDLANFSCAEFNLCNAECSAGCADQFRVRRCAVDCRAKVAARRQPAGIGRGN